MVEQGVTFAVVEVSSDLLNGPENELEELRGFLAGLFPTLPVVLMARGRNGEKTFHGRRDIARFLSTLRRGSIEWTSFRLS